MSFKSYLEYLEQGKKQKITENFTLFEIANSATAIARKIDNTPTKVQTDNAINLVKNILQPVRTYFKLPMIVECMIRNAELNKAVGGVSTSQHAKGEAADFYIKGVRLEAIVEYIRKNLLFDQLILERTGGAEWIHVSLCKVKNKNRKMVLKYDGKKYVKY